MLFIIQPFCKSDIIQHLIMLHLFEVSVWMTWHMIHMMGLPDISRTSRQVSDHLSQKTVDVNHFEPTRSWNPVEKGLFIKNVRISYFTSKNTSKHIKTLKSISFQAQNHEPFQTTEQSLHPRKLTLTMATTGKGPSHPSFEFPAANFLSA